MAKRTYPPVEVIIGVSFVEYFGIADGEVPLEILEEIQDAETFLDEAMTWPWPL